MTQGFLSRGFFGRPRDAATARRLPPGQYLTQDFPVLSAGPTPHTPKEQWDFSVTGAVEMPQRWDWSAFRSLPREPIRTDIHCVTKWSKIDTMWEGVSLDAILSIAKPQAHYVVAFCDGGYTTNFPLAALLNQQAWIVDTYNGAPLTPEHGGPVRLLVPHLYFWKSAKWVRGLDIIAADQPGFWEVRGYHNDGDPWLEQRYQDD
jgi:DMSO/TMAO reductase YedYZ molybdopterin-dependent catalytic subunit